MYVSQNKHAEKKERMNPLAEGSFPKDEKSVYESFLSKHVQLHCPVTVSYTHLIKTTITTIFKCKGAKKLGLPK